MRKGAKTTPSLKLASGSAQHRCSSVFLQCIHHADRELPHPPWSLLHQLQEAPASPSSLSACAPDFSENIHDFTHF